MLYSDQLPDVFGSCIASIVLLTPIDTNNMHLWR